MSPRHRGSRDGFALPATIFALVVIGALVSGGLLISSQEARISASYDLGAQAFSVADYGLNELLGTWRNQDLIDASSETYPRAGEAWASSRYLGDYRTTVRSLGNRLYLIRVTGTATTGPHTSTRSLAAVARTQSAELPYESALSILGTLSVEGRAGISGADLCRYDTVPGVTTTDVGNVSTSGNGDVWGDPAVEGNTNLTVDSLSQFGDVHLDDLIDWATRVYASGANPTNMQPTTTVDDDGETICDTSDTNNWGDTIASNPCGGYFPVVYGQGDLALNGAGQGAMAQGILIVEGDLTIDGNVDFKGVVIAKGDLIYAGTGGHVEGAMIIMGNGSSYSAGNSLLDYNSCTVADALNGGIRARTLASRYWTDLSGTIRPLGES